MMNNEHPTTSYLDAAFSLFDEQFSIAELEESVAQDVDNSGSVIESLRRAVQRAAANTEEMDPLDQMRYVVDLDPETQEALDAGEIRLDTNAAGEMFAQLKDEDGRYGRRLPIREELADEGLSVENAEAALQMDAIGEKLKAVLAALESVEERIANIEEGRQNDRLGLFYSGLSLYIEAGQISDGALKKQIVAQALKALSDSSAQMIQELRSNIRYLTTEQYFHAKKITGKIEEQLASIHDCYDVIYRAAMLKAMIYYDLGEVPAMLTAINEYGRFIENQIVPYAGKLSELDRHDQFIEKGTWGRIAGTLRECEELNRIVTQNHTYYIDSEETSL